jgi:hypothetical protein
MSIYYPLWKKVILWLLTMIVLAACTPATEETTAPPATIAIERPTTIPTVEEATAISIATKEATAMPIAGDVLIRIYNKTGLDLETIRVQFPSQTEDYGSLANGTSSDFHIIHEAYRYAFIQVNSGDQAYVLQPIDYVGETLLAPGYYTYSLRRSGPNLMLDLIEGDEPLPMQPSLEPEASTPCRRRRPCWTGWPSCGATDGRWSTRSSRSASGRWRLRCGMPEGRPWRP